MTTIFKSSEYWIKNNFIFISKCMDYCYSNNPYTNGLFSKLYLHNVLYNTPLLLMLSYYIKSISHKYLKIIFSNKETYYLYLIYNQLYPTQNTDLLFTSQKMYLNPTHKFNQYVNSITPNKTLVIDLFPSNLIPQKYFKNQFPNLDVDFLSLNKICNIDHITQFANLVRYGKVNTFKDTPIFDDLKYPVYIVYPIEKNIQNMS